MISVAENSTTIATYQYDSNSRLLQRVAGGTTTNYTWDGWDLVKEEKTGTITETTRYAVPQGGVQSFVRNGNRFYLHGDALSSSQLVTDSNGNQAARIIYGAWGEELYASDSVPNGLDARFVGGLGVRNDAATGLIYMRHRWYDPIAQRFISRDPIGLMGDTNLYRYGANNPVTNVDFTGLHPNRDDCECPDRSAPAPFRMTGPESGEPLGRLDLLLGRVNTPFPEGIVGVNGERLQRLNLLFITKISVPSGNNTEFTVSDWQLDFSDIAGESLYWKHAEYDPRNFRLSGRETNLFRSRVSIVSPSDNIRIKGSITIFAKSISKPGRTSWKTFEIDAGYTRDPKTGCFKQYKDFLRQEGP